MKSWPLALLTTAALISAGCAAQSGTKHRNIADHEGATAPLFNDLGQYRHAITTSSPLAQKYFDQGLILAYRFNHAEAWQRADIDLQSSMF